MIWSTRVLAPARQKTPVAILVAPQHRTKVARRHLLMLAALPLAAALTWHARGTLGAKRSSQGSPESLLYLPPADRLGPLSLGYKEALADLIWLRAIIFAGAKKNGEKHHWLARYVSTINHLAPNFRQPYVWGGVVSMYNGKEVDRKMVEQAVAIMREGVERFPEDHELLFNLGMVLYRDYESLGDIDPQNVQRYKEEGVKLIRKAAAFGASPLIRRLAVSLNSKDSDDALEAEFLRRQLLRADDPELQQLLKRKLRELHLGHQVATLEQARGQFMAEHEKRYPYLPLSVYAVLHRPAPSHEARQVTP